MKLTLIITLLLGSFFAKTPQAASEAHGDGTMDHLMFIENKGQWSSNVLYRVHSGALRLDLEKDAMNFQIVDPFSLRDLKKATHGEIVLEEDFRVRGHNFRMEFLGTPDQLQAFGEQKIDYYHNYFLGDDRSRWASHVGIYKQVNYLGLYEGIDLRVTEKSGNLKYEYIVEPGGNPEDIQIRYSGIEEMDIQDGQLHLETSVGTIIDKAPVAYQFFPGQLHREEIPMKYVINGDILSYKVAGEYDPTIPLVLDPELVFGSYSGAMDDNWGFAATYSVNGDAYGAGITFGDYPTTPGAFDTDFSGGSCDVSISKFSADGSQLLYSTYLGGLSSEMPSSMIENQNGELVVWGVTGSSDFPMAANAFEDSFSGGGPETFGTVSFFEGTDGFLVVLSADGSNIEGSSFLGGSSTDAFVNTGDFSIQSINYGDVVRGEVTTDSEDNILIVSTTLSSDFPASGVEFSGGIGSSAREDAVVIKMSPDASSLMWANYLGGSERETGISISADEEDNVYVLGTTTSEDFPTTAGVLHEQSNGGTSEAFVSHILGDGTQLVASSYIGTEAEDLGYLLDVDLEGDVYLLGQTEGDYPVTPNVYSNPGSSGFLQKLTPDLSTSIFSTVVGNGGDARLVPTAFLVDVCGRIYISGWGGITNSFLESIEGFPISGDAFQSTTDGSDFHLMVLEPDAAGLEYGTYFGGGISNEHVDGGTSRFDPRGVVYQAVCAGCGANSDFPTTAGVVSNTNNSSNCNMAVFKFDFELTQLIANADVSDETGCQDYVFEFENNTTGADQFMWDFGDGTTSTEMNPSHVYETPGTYVASLIASAEEGCVGVDTVEFIITVLALSCDSLSAGPDVTVSSADPVTTLAGGFEGCGDFEWIGGTGSFGTNANDPMSLYTLSTEEVEAGMAILVASLMDSSQTCFDTMVITVFQESSDSIVYDFDDCDASTGETKDYSEFTANGPTDLSCAVVSASNIYRVEPHHYRHSCTPGVDGTPAICVSSMDTCDFIPNSENALRFDLDIAPNEGEAVQISGLSFYERAPELFDWINGSSGPNNYPTLYGVRILVDGAEIYRQEDLATNLNWTMHDFDLSGEMDLRFSGDPVMVSFELLGYCLVGEDSEVTAWDVDELQIDLDCVFPGVTSGGEDTEMLSTTEELQSFIGDPESFLQYHSEDTERPYWSQDNGVRLLPSYPNPTTDFTYFGFYMEEKVSAAFQVIDMSGRVLFEQTRDYDSGQHVIRLDKATLGHPSGTVICRLAGRDFELFDRVVFN